MDAYQNYPPDQLRSLDYVKVAGTPSLHFLFCFLYFRSFVTSLLSMSFSHLQVEAVKVSPLEAHSPSQAEVHRSVGEESSEERPLVEEEEDLAVLPKARLSHQLAALEEVDSHLVEDHPVALGGEEEEEEALAGSHLLSPIFLIFPSSSSFHISFQQSLIWRRRVLIWQRIEWK